MPGRAAAVDQVRHPERSATLGLPPALVALRVPPQILVIIAFWAATKDTHRRQSR